MDVLFSPPRYYVNLGFPVLSFCFSFKKLAKQISESSSSPSLSSPSLSGLNLIGRQEETNMPAHSQAEKRTFSCSAFCSIQAFN